ncbi:hypothetical protein LCGC14_1278330 [marine sediment metagenome]|uniref:Uncharacterized protein n=1 Tax=marine sediment metagenome TaxID=412755 RepID=A0A0F9NCN9_9ZZZZ
MATNGFDPSKHITDLRGKEYLEVKWRLVWLRDLHPEAIIVTELLEHIHTAGFALFKAEITIPVDGEIGGGSATGHGSETAEDFGDYIEKAETKAIGRALAALGYGTQFCGGELDEMAGKRGERIVDAPVQRTESPQQPQEQADGARLMLLKFDGECLGCGQPISKGTNAFYSYEKKAVWHERCSHLLADSADEPQPKLEPVGADPGPARDA